MKNIFGAGCYICILNSILLFSTAFGNTSSMGQNRSQLDDIKISSGGDNQVSAYCHISSKELLATAELTTRAILQGICNPREIEDRLHNIESQMADQLNVIKTMILNIEDKLAQQDSQYRRANRKLHGAVAELSESVQSCTSLPNSASNSIHVETSQATPTSQLKQAPASSFYSSPITIGVRSTGADPDEEDMLNPRQEEIDRYNSSIHIEGGKRVFSYFWKVGDMEYKLKRYKFNFIEKCYYNPPLVQSWGPRRSLRSPSFYIFEYGYMMYIRLFPRQNGQNVYAHVGLTKIFRIFSSTSIGKQLNKKVIINHGHFNIFQLFRRNSGTNNMNYEGIIEKKIAVKKKKYFFTITHYPEYGDYDEALEWPFILKHRISILDQVSSPFQDISSRVWDPKILCSGWNWKRPATGDNHECVGLGFPTEDLRAQHFLRDDNLLIKLTVAPNWEKVLSKTATSNHSIVVVITSYNKHFYDALANGNN